MKITVFGARGMLGRYVTTYFSKYTSFKIVPLCRQDFDVSLATLISIENILKFPKGSGESDIVINCAGAIKPIVHSIGPLQTVKVNSIFPHILADVCKKFDYTSCIHVTTDCVFDGKYGRYTEASEHNAIDLYGISKSAGEPENCTVIRTSIIGEELDQKRSLVEWAKSNKDKTVNGYINHFWNGVTCLELCKLIHTMIVDNITWDGVRHIYSNEVVSKYNLLSMISDIYELNMNIVPFSSPQPCNRSLDSVIEKTPIFVSLYDQIKEMRRFKL